MFPECTLQYDTKKRGDIYVFVEKQILVKYLNLYQQPRSSNLIGWKLEVGMAS